MLDGNRKSFTAGRVNDFTCEKDKKQAFLWDTDSVGLGLRATDKGAKSYIFQAKLRGQTIRVTIGSPLTWTIEAARREARRLRVIVDGGQDPRKIKAAQIEADQAKHEAKLAKEKEQQSLLLKESVTLGDVWPQYIENRKNAKRRGGKQGWSHWHIRDHEDAVSLGGRQKIRGNGLTEDGALVSLLPVKLMDLTSDKVSDWLAHETAKRPTRAALAFRLLSVFVNWCDSQPEYAGLVPTGTCKSKQVTNELPASNAKKNDCLQREQLASWFASVKHLSNPVFSAYLQALLLTGARRRELAGLQWHDIDFQWKTLTIRDKIEGTRIIPLTPYVAYLLNGLPRRNHWVFSSTSSKNGQIAEPTPAHKRALLTASLPDLSLHGLRRSFGSLAEWTEAPTGVVAQIMGHKPSAIAEKHYRERPIDLLRLWHEKIEQWILLQADIRKPDNYAGLRVVTN